MRRAIAFRHPAASWLAIASATEQPRLDDAGAWLGLSETSSRAMAGEMAAARSMKQSGHAGDGLSLLVEER